MSMFIERISVVPIFIFILCIQICRSSGILGLVEILLPKDNDLHQISSKVRLRVYNGQDFPSEPLDLPLDAKQEILQGIDDFGRTAFYIHGYQEHFSNESIRTIVDAYRFRGSENLIVVDWSELAFGNYLVVASRCQSIGKELSTRLDDLVALGLDPNKLHIIGHSLGAQIAGFIGKYSQHRFPRITALDAANPGFYQFGAEHVDANSADFVDAIHTDSGLYGTPDQTGTVDFYANGGVRPQPGCDLVTVPLSLSSLCSHHRSWRLYAESVRNPGAFEALQCDNYGDYLLGKCDENRRVFYGYAVPTDISGKYFFDTGSSYPFGKDTQSNWTTPQQLNGIENYQGTSK